MRAQLVSTNIVHEARRGKRQDFRLLWMRSYEYLGQAGTKNSACDVSRGIDRPFVQLSCPPVAGKDTMTPYVR